MQASGRARSPLEASSRRHPTTSTRVRHSAETRQSDRLLVQRFLDSAHIALDSRETGRRLPKAKAAPIPGGLRLRPQDHAAPTPRGCGAEPELLQEPPIVVLSLFKGLAVASGENSRLPRRAIDTVHGLYPLGSKFGRSGVLFSICTKIFDNPQEDAAENFADARSSVPARARFLRWAPPLPQASATASSSGRTARIAARGIRETAIGNRKFFRVNRELIRENRQSWRDRTAVAASFWPRGAEAVPSGSKR